MLIFHEDKYATCRNSPEVNITAIEGYWGTEAETQIWRVSSFFFHLYGKWQDSWPIGEQIECLICKHADGTQRHSLRPVSR